MATPVVAGSVALMLQANPALTPNAVKAILQYTSQVNRHYNRLTQGVGFLNAKGAVELASYLGGRSTIAPAVDGWSKELLWGNHLVRGGSLTSAANAWSTRVTWGAGFASAGYPIAWGVLAGSGQPWTVPCADAGCSAISWQGGSSRNVVWGGTCGGADCTTAWSPGAGGAALATSSENEIVVWGSANYDDDQIVVWGSAEAEMVVWGSAGEFEIVVWGSECSACEPVVWGR